VTSIQILPGSPALSAFRRERLLQRFARLNLPIAGILACYEHFVWAEATLDAGGRERLAALLDYGERAAEATPGKHDLVLRVIPRYRPGPARPPTSCTTAACLPCAGSSAASAMC
jgi:phosphoribosylformylglycinamidine synthase